MQEVLLWIMGVAIFVGALCVSVALHEAGHMAAAKFFKLKVPAFFVGFGPKIFSFKKGETEYGARWIPLGGFVRIEDERYEEGSYESSALIHVHPMKRIIVFLAGPAVNLVLGVLLVVGAIMTVPYDKPTTEVYVATHCEAAMQVYGAQICGAHKAGIQAGEKIVSVDSIEIVELSKLKEILKDKTSVSLTTESPAGLKDYTVDVVNGQLGVSVKTEKAYRNALQAATFLEGIVTGAVEAITHIPETAPSVASSIVTGERDEKAPGSLVAAGKAYGNVATSEEPVSEKLTNYLLITGLFNLSLGLVNGLPLLPLDGGRIAIALYDWVRRGIDKITKRENKPVGKKAFLIMSVASAVVVFGFMLMLIASDFSLLFRGNL